MTTNMGRIGGFERDFSPKFHELLRDFIKTFPKKFGEFQSLMERNRIFMDRTIGTGPISAERALSYSFTGPNLRAAGVDYDVRVAQPYSSYDDFDFIVPIGTAGDTYDRFMVRQTEIMESYKLIKNAYENLPQDLTMQMYLISIYLKRQMYTPRWRLLSIISRLLWVNRIFL